MDDPFKSLKEVVKEALRGIFQTRGISAGRRMNLFCDLLLGLLCAFAMFRFNETLGFLCFVMTIGFIGGCLKWVR